MTNGNKDTTLKDIEKMFIENMGKIDYDIFLMSQLLRDMVEPFNVMNYDILYEESQKIFKEFEKTQFNSFDTPIYECIVDYIKHNLSKLTERGNELID